MIKYFLEAIPETTAVIDIIETIGTGLQNSLTWIGTVISSFFTAGGAFNAILPVLGLSIGLKLVGMGVRYVRSFIWGD